MIKALFAQIEGVLQKEFLFAAFLPTLVFSSVCFATFALMVGFSPMLIWAQGQSTAEQVVIPAVASLAIVVAAYVLSGIRPFLWRLWSGQVSLFILAPFLRIGESWTRVRRQRLVAESNQPHQWAEMPDWFRGQCAKPVWDVSGARPIATAQQIYVATSVLRRLDPSMGVQTVKERLDRSFIALVKGYDCKSLKNLYRDITGKLSDWKDEERVSQNEILWRLDRQFGRPECARATRLGNVVESYQTYSSTRYEMEPEIFWPHLQQYIGGSTMKGMLENARTILDFALAMASFGVLYAVACLIGGPWLAVNDRLWLGLAAVGIVCSILFYRVAVFAAEQFGDLFRACFDLYRFSLLEAFRREMPANLSGEKVSWQQLSQLLVYGKSPDFPLKHPVTSPVSIPP